jgi:hypothetical protein
VRRLSWGVVYAGVALTAAATLMLELALTRIFSVVFYYHFAFLAISIALFGLGAGGVLSYLLALPKGVIWTRLGQISSLTSVVVVLALAIILGMGGGRTPVSLVLVYAAASLPFLGAGMVLSLAIAETMERVERVYFFDLAGAAAGCLLLIPFLNVLGGPGSVVGAAVLFASAGAVWFGLAGSIRGRAGSILLALILVALILYNKSTPVMDVKGAKGVPLPSEELILWNSFSRVSVVPREGGPKKVMIDADAMMLIPRYDFDRLTPEDAEQLSSGGLGLPHVLRPGAKTLILSAGTGFNVARSLAAGSKDITAVELNPLLTNSIMRNRFRDESFGLYYRPELRLHTEDSRGFIRRSEEKFQIIQSSPASRSALGASALTESTLFTVESFTDMLGHLTGDGLLAVTRRGTEPPRESARLVALAREALARVGEREAARHVLVVREKAGDAWADTVIVARKPLSNLSLVQTQQAAANGSLEILYAPGTPRESVFRSILLAQDPRAIFDSYPYDISPVSDDRPFFYYLSKRVLPWNSAATPSEDPAVPLVVSLLIVSAAATIVLLLLPPLVLGARLPKEKGVPIFLLYFVWLGVAYVLTQVGLIQKLVLFLGHPTYALAVVVFSLLVFSGVGSYWSRRFGQGLTARVPTILLMVAFSLAVLAVALAPAIDAGAALPLPLKVAITVLLISPCGFLMGMPFPAGLRLLEAWHAPAIRWAWSLNSAASVLGSCGAVFLALHIGFRNTLLVGASLYLLALLSLRMGERRMTKVS